MKRLLSAHENGSPLQKRPSLSLKTPATQSVLLVSRIAVVASVDVCMCVANRIQGLEVNSPNDVIQTRKYDISLNICLCKAQ